MNKTLIVGLTLSLGAGVLVGAAAFNGPRELRATRLVVTDANGRDVMVLTADPAGAGVIDFLDARGKSVMKLDAGEGSLLRYINDSRRQHHGDMDSFIEEFKQKHANPSRSFTDSQTSRDSSSARDSKSDSQRESQSDSRRDKQSTSDSGSKTGSDAGSSANAGGSKNTNTKTSGSASGTKNTSGSATGNTGGSSTGNGSGSATGG